MLLKRRIMKQVNELITHVACDSLNIVHVNEYPKCGGSWVSRLIRSYLGINRDYGTTKLVRQNSVIHRHKLTAPHYKKPVIVIRDPRDVWVSFYFYEVYGHKGTHREIELKSYDANASEEQNLLNYMNEKTQFPERFTPGYPYTEFCKSWLNKDHIHLVRYEDVHLDPEAALTGILEFIGEKDIDPQRVKAAVRENKFEVITGRKSGIEDKFSHKRKGIVGDWKNLFNADSCSFVRETQQDLLEMLGYETDDSWVEKFSKPLEQTS